MLQIEDLHVRYGGIHSLKGISLDVSEQRIVTLLGSNGAGKSTTVRAVSGLVPIAAGNISFISNRSTFTTRSFPPSLAAPTFTAVWQSSMSAQWTDSSPSNNQVNLTTYTVIFSSDTSSTGLAVSTRAWSGEPRL